MAFTYWKVICHLLYRLGITANYTGFRYTAYAVALCVAQPGRLQLVTKWVYPEVAKRYGTNWKAVERNIRAVSGIAWEQGRPALEELVGRALPQRPYAAQLLSIQSYSLLSQYAGPLAVHGLGEAVTFPGENDNVGVVDQAVNESGGEPVVPKDSVPLAEFQIGGNDQAFPLVAVRNHLEKQFCGILVEWDKANLINDQ